MIDAPSQTKRDIFSLIRQHQAKIQAYGVKKLGLFGSFVRGEQHGESDIDLLVEFEAGEKNFDNFMQLSFLLEELLERPIELVTVESLSPYIRPHIVQEVEYVTFSA
ncbi:MAG: nucleotidyltransferase domain-containing protein [Ardenticatenaceae bacterium]|nr:nucleotidyltransferase domain-containing protein [Ardenticatenaceae bacterium]